MMVYGIQFWIECKGGLKTANELSDVLDDLVYDGNLSLAYSNHSIMGAGLFMKNAVQNNFESIREILNEFADKIKYVSEWDYEDSSNMKWGVHTLGESKKSVRKSMKEGLIDIRKQIQDYADANEFDITVQTTPKNELIIVFGGTSDTDKIYNALMKELKSKCVNLSKVDVKKKNDIVIVTWDLNFSNKGMFDEIIVEGTIDLIDNLSEVVNLHYVF